jgi:hypothetical protein
MHQNRSTSTNRDLPERLPQLVDTRSAAAILARSANSLKRWRYEGVGPAYISIRGRVVYDVAVLEEFIRQNTRTPSVRAASEKTDRGTV